MLFHIKNEWVDSQTLSSQNLIKSIMFLSRLLNKIEKNYWSTKLKVTCLVWILWKICHFVKFATHFTIIYTDHAAIIKIACQISLSIISTDKLNLCLIQAFQYIQQFKLQIVHKFRKMHLILNVLSWFSSHAFLNDIESLDVLHTDIQMKVSHIRLNELIYTIMMIELSADFKKHLKNSYIKNHQLQRIHDIIVNNDK